ncbi:hypothetical protein GWP43_04555 [Treponema vincentii]|uniref:Uncharacterized protein n=1 Tax=Treponema vincentii TaxID=69710 RepID=A0A6P1Y1M5_9SPIR|nr:hypothetical protein [Treponema vincentii]QHX42832.1 hypothetical protein GWP43_04555 [Treponema vincentii]
MQFPLFAPILMVMLSRRILLPQYKNSLSKAQPFHVTLLKIGGIDARSVQKTPAGVLVVRRGLFFVKRQRRYTAYFQKILDIKIVGGTITQQLSNSATQQLSNSATQQLSNSATQQLSNSATQQLSNSATQQLSNSATQA